MIRLGVLGSTRGSHLVPIMQAIAHDVLDATISIVLSNKPDAGILDLARSYQLPYACLEPQGITREQYDELLSDKLAAANVDLIVLLGFMRILSAKFVDRWAGKLINVHPSLLPAHAGLMDLAVHRAVIDAGDVRTGCTVHQVIAEVDAGPIIWQKECQVLPDDTPESLKKRVQALESEALIEVIAATLGVKCSG